MEEVAVERLSRPRQERLGPACSEYSEQILTLFLCLAKSSCAKESKGKQCQEMAWEFQQHLAGWLYF